VRTLKKGSGNFIAKVFRGKDIGLLVKQTKLLFDHVYIAKPKCSRNSSIEAFMVGVGFKGKETIGLESDRLNLWDALTTLNHLHNFSDIYNGQAEQNVEEEEDLVEFIACGKDEVLDPDMNYTLEDDPLEGHLEGALEGDEKLLP